MRRELTVKQANVLNVLTNYIERESIPPSYRDLMKLVDLSSTSNIKAYLDALKAKGYITWEPGQPRTLKVIKNIKTAS